MQIILATTNLHKAIEIQALFNQEVKVLTLKDIGFKDEILENGKTFEENARLKVSVLANFIQQNQAFLKNDEFALLADDSGLEVDMLKGAPGVISARYAGEPSNDSANNEKLLQALKGAPGPKRTAQFRCVLAALLVSRAVLENFHIQIFEGICRGKIGFKPKGRNGFGYDPLFFPDGYCKTFGELPPAEKNQISHRAKAMMKFKMWLMKLRG